MADCYESWSPNNYCLNNPINYIDPDGRDVVDMGDRIVINGDDLTYYLAALKSVQSGAGSMSNLMEAAESAAVKPGEGSGHFAGALGAENTPSNNPSVTQDNGTGYIYDEKDIAVRNSMMIDDNVIGTYISSQESKGIYEPLSAENYWRMYGHTMGTLLAGGQYLPIAFGLAGMAQVGGTQTTPKKFNYQRQYSHSASQALQRGISQTQVNDALNSPLKVKGIKYDNLGRPSQTYIGKDATVVVNPNTGKIVTTWKTGSRTVRALSK